MGFSSTVEQGDFTSARAKMLLQGVLRDLTGLEDLTVSKYNDSAAAHVLNLSATRQVCQALNILGAIEDLEPPAPGWTASRKERATALIKFLLADTYLESIDENAYPDREKVLRAVTIASWEEFLTHPSATAEEHVEFILISTLALDGIRPEVKQEILSRSLRFVVSPVVAEWAQARIASNSAGGSSDRGTAG